MKISKILFLTTGALLLSSSLYAMGGMKRPSFSDIDANGDKKITEKEFKDFGEQRSQNRPQNAPQPPKFSDIDTNEDGAISESEFKAMQEKGRQGRGQRGGKGGGRGNF